MSAHFRFDPNRCIKCWACVVACKQWHNIPAGQPGYREVVEEDEGVFPEVTRTFVSRARAGCDLCASCGGSPHCALTCPTLALRYS